MSGAVDSAPFDLSISLRAKYRLYQPALHCWSLKRFCGRKIMAILYFLLKKNLQEMSGAADNAPFDLPISSRVKYRLYQPAPLLVPQMILWP